MESVGYVIDENQITSPFGTVYPKTTTVHELKMDFLRHAKSIEDMEQWLEYIEPFIKAFNNMRNQNVCYVIGPTASGMSRHTVSRIKYNEQRHNS